MLSAAHAHSLLHVGTVVSRIYAPRFATSAVVESVGGAYMHMRDLTFYFANTPPLPGPHLDVDMGAILKTVTEAGLTPICLRSSCPPETRWSRSTDRGWQQRRRRRFPSTPWVDATCGHACDRWRIP